MRTFWQYSWLFGSHEVAREVRDAWGSGEGVVSLGSGFRWAEAASEPLTITVDLMATVRQSSGGVLVSFGKAGDWWRRD